MAAPKGKGEGQRKGETRRKGTGKGVGTGKEEGKGNGEIDEPSCVASSFAYIHSSTATGAQT